ncbi:MAG: glycosyltransferase, partial [Candidatus Hydrogenedentales bacterium]
MDCTKLQECQESILRARISEEGGIRNLLFFLLAKRDFASIDELASHDDAQDENARRMFDAVSLGRGRGGAESLATRLDGEKDPWLHYTVAKALLREGKTQAAIAVASRYLRLFPKDCLLLNLAAKSLAALGEQELASRMIDSSLKLNPIQGDMVALKDCLQTGRPWPVPLYLDPFPMAQLVAFYVPIYNVEQYIRQAIEGLIAQNYPLAEIIAVDDGTPDRSIEIAMEYPVRIVRHDR